MFVLKTDKTLEIFKKQNVSLSSLDLSGYWIEFALIKFIEKHSLEKLHVRGRFRFPDSGLPPCSEFYYCSRSLSVLAVSIYFPTLSLEKLQSAKFRAALRIYDLGVKYFRALSDRNDPEHFFEI